VRLTVQKLIDEFGEDQVERLIGMFGGHRLPELKQIRVIKQRRMIRAALDAGKPYRVVAREMRLSLSTVVRAAQTVGCAVSK